jgi:hypothetical protein
MEGLPVDVSVNCTDWPVVGEAGLKVNDASRAGITDTNLEAVSEPELFVTVKVTVFDPAAA